MSTVLQFLRALRPAIPMSREKPCTIASNSELRRWIADGSVRLNEDRWMPDEPVPALVWSLIFFPNSKSRTTVV